MGRFCLSPTENELPTSLSRLFSPHRSAWYAPIQLVFDFRAGLKILIWKSHMQMSFHTYGNNRRQLDGILRSVFFFNFPSSNNLGIGKKWFLLWWNSAEFNPYKKKEAQQFSSLRSIDFKDYRKKKRSCLLNVSYVDCTNHGPEIYRGCPRGVMVKAMDCGIVVREFVLQSRYYVHFRANALGKCMNPLILPAMG